MAVQLAVAGTQGSMLGTLRLTVTDPNAEVASAAFAITELGIAERGRFPADRTPAAGISEKDVLLSEQHLTRVQPLVTLKDGTVMRAAALTFGVRFEPLNAPPGTIASANAAGWSRTLRVDATCGSATRWRCYARCGGWPTDDGTERGVLVEDYFRFEGLAADLFFVMNAVPGAWSVITLGYNPAGQAGPRMTKVVAVAA